MAKFNPKQTAFYLQTLQDILQETQNTADQASPFFVKIDEAKQAQAVGDMASADFAEIKAEFDDAVANYQSLAARLASLSTPVCYLGVQKILVKAYQDYAQATALMAASLTLSPQAVDNAKFEQSEEDQALYLSKIQGQVAKIFGA
ncbi:chemotaxis protein [Leuconostocaceae bacterium ESL0958]|nr:chemotaxis protein [Leuconostocaceae bacterium ESL0958]